MRKTLLGMAGAAALLFGIDARAGDAGAVGSDELRDESGQARTAMVHAKGASSDERMSVEAEPAKPCDATGAAGGASGEPSAIDAERAASHAEFLRNVWTAP